MADLNPITAIQALQDAQQILANLKTEAYRATGTCFNNPVWDKLNHAHRELGKQVAALLEDAEEFPEYAGEDYGQDEVNDRFRPGFGTYVLGVR